MSKLPEHLKKSAVYEASGEYSVPVQAFLSMYMFKSMEQQR